MNDVEKHDAHEAPNDDPRENGGEKSVTQTDTPWKQTPQNSTDPSQADPPKPDLEKWDRTRTH